MPDEDQVRKEIERDSRRRTARRTRKSLRVCLCLLMITGVALSWLRLELVVMNGSGMADTLRGGDVVLFEHEWPLPGDIGVPVRAGQLALIDYDGGTRHRELVRRVIGTAGDEIFVLEDGHVTVNGESLEEPYAVYRAINPDEDPGSGLITNPFMDVFRQVRSTVSERWAETIFPITVPEGYVFVLSDDREAFDDSRSRAFGLVRTKDVHGVAAAVVWPAHRASLLRDFDFDTTELIEKLRLQWMRLHLTGGGEHQGLQ